MNNYEYIIASLPVLEKDTHSGALDPEGITQWIRSQCSAQDNALIDKLLSGFEGSGLDEEFYAEASRSGNSFIKDWFAYDLTMRNAKVRWLNNRLGRPALMDTLPEPEPDGAIVSRIESALQTDGILERERALDDLLWAKAAELVTFDYFDINVVLSFLARMMIAGRWTALDEEAGREMFRKLVKEVRGTFGEVRYEG